MFATKSVTGEIEIIGDLPAVRSLAVVEEELMRFLATLPGRTNETTRALIRLYAERRAAAHREYFARYGEWDWIVRRRYIDLVRPLGYEFPDFNREGNRGYYFELRNPIPNIPWMLPDRTLKGPEFMTLCDDENGKTNGNDYLYQFVRPENIEKCKMSQKTADAFLLLKHLEAGVWDGEGFRISSHEVVEVSSKRARGEETDESIFDREGYKSHLLSE